MTNHVCVDCKLSKPEEEFTKSKGVNSYRTVRLYKLCRVCNALRAKKWRDNNKGYKSSGLLKSIPKEDRILMSCLGTKITDCRLRAKKRNYPCNIDKMYLYNMYKEQDGKCALSGVTFTFNIGDMTVLTVDKIDPKKGYVEGNVQLVCWAMNRAKGEMSLDDFIDMCQAIIEHQQEQRLSKG